jgi:dynein regulatory complex protein 1
MSGNNDTDFTTNSPDKEERKRTRKKRVEKTNAPDSIGNEESRDKDLTSFRSGYQQAQESILNLDRRKHSGIEQVTSSRVATNDSEAKRRVHEEDVKKSRLVKLQHEALNSAKANAAIEMKWAELLEKEIPQELHHEIQLQMESCRGIIKSKDDLINDFQQQLRSKDEEYVRALKQHAEDIDDLLSKIRREFNELQAEYDKELDVIEETYLEERERLINEHTGEIDGMFEQRRKKEVDYKETKQKSEDQYQKEVEDLITRGADQYNKLKIELEMNIQALKQQLEEIRATYQLNTEKLDYNYRVLTELDVEKNAELARYKRRLNKLKAQLNNLVTRFTEMEAADTKTNHDLTEDYRSLTLKYKDLQAKFRHFEIADTTKYDEVWSMHEEEVKDLVDQLLKADKIISEQQLGWLWRPPDMHALQQVLGRHGGLGLSTAPTKAEEEGKSKKQDDRVDDGKEPNEESAEEKMRKISGYKVKAVLKVLANEAGFMINPQVVESLDSLPPDEADLSKAEAMLKALGVKSEEKLNTLVNYFFKGIRGDDSLDSAMEEEGDFENELLLLLNNGPEEITHLKDMIRPEDVISAVKTYIEDMSVEAGPVGVSSAVSGGTKVTQEEIRIAQKRLASMRNYWTQLSQVVSDDTVSVWKQLESDCHNLREMLSKRASTVSEVDDLSRKNSELKALLNQYLGDNVTNSSFKVPPAQVMKVREITQIKKKDRREG